MAVQLGDTTPPMVLLRPGDQVLVAFAEDIDADTARDIAAQLHTSFTHVSFTVVGGVTGIAVRTGGGGNGG